MRIFILSLSFLFVVLNVMPVAAEGFSQVGTVSFVWDGIFAGSRITALGGSDMADGGPAALLINPSPLAGDNALDFSFDRTDYFAGTDIATYAGAAQWSGLRLNFAVQDFCIDDVLVRTAYNPEGIGDPFDVLYRISLTGLSYDLGRHFFGDKSMRWSVGAVWRHYFYDFDDTSDTADSFDLGTTVGWTSRHDNGWSAVTGAVSLQNVKEETFTYDDRESYLMQPLRVGLTLETAFNWAEHEGDLFKLMLAFTHCSEMTDTYVDDSDHMGVEVLLFDALAIRYGDSSKVVGNISSWGVGLKLDERLLGPFTVHVDYGQMGFNNMVTTDSYSNWGMRVQYRY